MKAGISFRDITPPLRTRLADHTRYSTGVHDPLYVRSLVLDDGSHPTAIVCLDLLFGDFAFCDEMRMLIQERSAIDHTLINFSQTHSGPSVYKLPDQVEENEPHEEVWINDLKLRILDSVEEACSKTVPVTLYAGRAPVQIGFNRRVPDEHGVVHMAVNKDGPVVPWVDVLHARNESNDPVAILFAHAAHPVIVHGASTETGRDFAGFAVDCIEKEWDGGATAMFAQGCCGNINGYPLRTGWDDAKEAGHTLGMAVINAVKNSAFINVDKLGFRSDSFMLPCEDLPSLTQLDADMDRLTIFDARPDESRLKKLQTIKDMVVSGEKPSLRFDMNRLSVGKDWGLIALTHEPFCEYELWIHEHAPYTHTMVMGDTNGMQAYVATDTELARGGKGGYEAGGYPCFWSHTVRVLNVGLAMGTECTIKQHLSNLWKAV